MHLDIRNPELEAILLQRMKAGSFASIEDLLLDVLRGLPDDDWTEEDRRALDGKVDRALQQVAAGKIHGPDEARRKLAAIRETHLADRG